jgi:uncharacterized membrane protein YhaH (DUF805 family)
MKVIFRWCLIAIAAVVVAFLLTFFVGDSIQYFNNIFVVLLFFFKI